MKKYVSPYLFFFIKDGALVAWDYKNHTQYQIESRYLSRLIAIAEDGDSIPIVDPINPIEQLDEELLASGFISFDEIKVEWGWDILSQIFHIGVQDTSLECDLVNYQNHLKEYLESCEKSTLDMPSLYTEKEGKKVSLPRPDLSLLSHVDLWSVLDKRKTCRSFNIKPISLVVASTLLYAVFGNIHPDWEDLTKYNLRQLGLRKSSPSAGALHPCEAYLVALNIENLKPGIYHYQSHDHVLTLIDEVDIASNLGYLLAGQHFATRLSAGIFISARFEKSWHKYRHSRGYVHPFLDAGHLSQTFQLCVTALGLQPWLTGAFLDEDISKLLKIEGTTEYPLFFLGVGHGDGNSLSQEMQEYCSQLVVKE